MSGIDAHLPPDLVLSPAVSYALLEIAYLVTAVDGRLTDEELAAFQVLAARLRGLESVRTSEVETLVAKFAHNVEPAEIEARVRALAPKLPAEHRELAYLLARARAFVDQAPHHPEDRLHTILGDVLQISADRREALARRVGLDGGGAA
jgi:hypothetical protein